MAAELHITPSRATSSNGLNLDGAKWYFYQSGTTTPQSVYTTSALSTPHSNPVEADAAGKFPNIFFDATLSYRGVLKTADDVTTIYDIDPINTDTLSQLAASGGSALVGFLQAGTGAVTRTAQAKMRDFVSVMDFIPAGTNTATTDCTAYIQAAEDYCGTSKKSLFFPAGDYRHNSTINRKDTNWFGDGLLQSRLLYYGSTIAINNTGTLSDRLRGTIHNMGFIGTNAGTNAIGITLGWNQRSTPLNFVNIEDFGGEGIYFNDQNWSMEITDVYMKLCGKTKTNGCGIGKDPAVDLGTWNKITIRRANVEFCGNTTSDAGGINLQTTTANRSLRFIDCDIEGNYARLTGTPGAEILVTNMFDVQFDNHYMEVISSQCLVGIELRGVTGGINGGYIRGDNIAVNQAGVKIRSGAGFVSNEVALETDISGFIQSIDAQNAVVKTGQIIGDKNFTGNATTQWTGNYAPRLMARKNAAQVVTSGTFQKVLFQVATYDTTGAFASSTYTPRTLGVYQVDLSIYWSATGANDGIIVAVYKNGADYKSIIHVANTADPKSVQLSTQIECTATTDTFEIYVRQTSGVDQTISDAIERTWLSIHYVGPSVF